MPDQEPESDAKLELPAVSKVLVRSQKRARLSSIIIDLKNNSLDL